MSGNGGDVAFTATQAGNTQNLGYHRLGEEKKMVAQPQRGYPRPQQEFSNTGGQEQERVSDFARGLLDARQGKHDILKDAVVGYLAGAGAQLAITTAFRNGQARRAAREAGK